MTTNDAINKVLSIARQEIGYLEKKNGNSLYDKSANAGYNNYTKYWAEIKPSFQGQPWCACFVTWVLQQAFGQENTKRLLKHYPFVYCPTMGNLFTLNANPKVGDIVLFYRNGKFAHTGIVSYVSGDYFKSIEGNTSSKGGIVPNGGAVCEKGYYNSSLPGTKFVTLDWDSISTFEDFTETPINKQGIITVDSRLNVRKKPDINASILGKYVTGAVVTLIAETDNGWYKTDKGYISKQYVQIIEEKKEEPIDFDNLVKNYLRELEQKEPADWSKDAREYCENQKIIEGNENSDKNYCSLLTREELAVIIYRTFGKKDE